MTNIRFKDSVQSGPLHPSIHHALNIVSIVWDQYFPTVDPVITSLRDSEHGSHSLHYGGPIGDVRIQACDVRTRNLTEAEQRVAVMQLRKYLGEAYDVVPEPTHIHIEYDPT